MTTSSKGVWSIRSRSPQEARWAIMFRSTSRPDHRCFIQFTAEIPSSRAAKNLSCIWFPASKRWRHASLHWRGCSRTAMPLLTLSEYYDNICDLDKVDWDIMTAKYWHDTLEDGDRVRRRQAEFLVHQFFPWELITEVAVIDSKVQAHV